MTTAANMPYSAARRHLYYVQAALVGPPGDLAQSHAPARRSGPGLARLGALFALALSAWVVVCGSASAQEKAQKGVDPSTRESRMQMRNDNDQTPWLGVDRALRDHPVLTPQASTRLFLESDINSDGVLTRSEVPAVLATLRTSFGKYDRNQDHRLTYSEFCDYVDAMPQSLVTALSARDRH